jgi:hypothetical protein
MAAVSSACSEEEIDPPQVRYKYNAASASSLDESDCTVNLETSTSLASISM